MKRVWIAGAAALSAGIALSPGAARAQEEGVFMKDLLGSIGIIEKEKPEIQYRERAPLVIPPRLELRQPVDPGRIEASNPAWPRDPDVMAERRRAAEARIPVTETEARRARSDSNTRLSTDEIRSGRRAGAGIPQDFARHRADNDIEDRFNPELRNPVRARLNPDAEEGATPSRRRLTQPPTDYRVPIAGVRATPDDPTKPKPIDEDSKDFLRQQRSR